MIASTKNKANIFNTYASNFPLTYTPGQKNYPKGLQQVLKKAKKDFENMEYFAFDVTNKDIAQFFNVQYQTTLLIFKDNKEVYRSIGETTKELIYDALKSSI